mgnify:CR=1 FL=1
MKKCPKCKGEMMKGKIKDYAYGLLLQQRWGAKLFSKNYKVDTFACKKCGYLESYLEDEGIRK